VSSAPAHLSSFTLDALALGALPAAEAALAHAHLAGCAACTSQLEAVRASGEEFARSVLPRTLARVHERAARPAWTRFLRAWTLLPVSALAAAAVLMLVLHGSATLAPTTRAGDDSGLAIKGGATLRVFADHESHVFQVRDGDRLAPGDRIRFVVEPAGLPYLLVASVDGKGTPSIYYPYDARVSGRLTQAITIELPGSIVLDAAPGPERLFALFSREPLDAQVVRAALAELGKRGPDAVRAARTLSTPAAAQVSLFFEKVVP
jgi:anti-sigma factor RsiW